MLGPPFLSVNTLIQFLTMLLRHTQQRLCYAFEEEQRQVHRRMHLHTPLIQLMYHTKLGQQILLICSKAVSWA